MSEAKKIWVDQEMWAKAEITRRLLPALVKRGIDLATLDDFLDRALKAKNTVIGGSPDGTDIHFDSDLFLGDVKDDPGSAHLFGKPDATGQNGGERPPGLLPTDPTPGTQAFFKLPVLERLKIANRINAGKLNA